MRALTAELLGTLFLVLLGCGAVVLGGNHVGQLGIALAFGIAVLSGAYAFGPISGAHFNPAVTLAVCLAGGVNVRTMLLYWAAQFLGAIIGAAILLAIAGPMTAGLATNGWGPGFQGSYPLASAALFEAVMTTLFVLVVLSVTHFEQSRAFAPIAIGLALTAIHIVGIQVTGVSVNPARSFGPALLDGGPALAQVWLFFAAPLLGAAAGAGIFRWRLRATPPKHAKPAPRHASLAR